jgi:hypothetical protein
MKGVLLVLLNVSTSFNAESKAFAKTASDYAKTIACSSSSSIAYLGDNEGV